MKILIWGTGNTAKAVLERGVYGEVVGFINSKMFAGGGADVLGRSTRV